MSQTGLLGCLLGSTGCSKTPQAQAELRAAGQCPLQGEMHGPPLWTPPHHVDRTKVGGSSTGWLGAQGEPRTLLSATLCVQQLQIMNKHRANVLLLPSAPTLLVDMAGHIEVICFCPICKEHKCDPLRRTGNRIQHLPQVLRWEAWN